MLGTVLIFITLIQVALLSNTSLDILIGKLTGTKQFLHSVALFIESLEVPGEDRSCGSSILNQEILLTAASCIKTNFDKVEAFTGNKNLLDGALLKVSHVGTHPKFDEERFARDIALLRLEQPLQLTARVERVALMKRLPPPPEAGIHPLKWAIIGNHSSVKGLIFLCRKKCREHVGSIPMGTFCVRYPRGRTPNDNAGCPLVRRRYIETGLLSFENVPLLDNAVAVYTNVSSYHGWKNISFDIMGGQLTEIEEFPHAVALFIESEEDPNVGRGCGASVINQEVLLTAASCVTTTRDKVEAYTGHKYMWKGMVSLVRRIRRHPTFDEQHFFNDIALMSLLKPLILGTTVGRVVLLRSPRHWPEEVAGFGASELQGKQSYLKFVPQKILHRRACLRRLKHVPLGTFCARHRRGYSAYDDAGSALVQRRVIQTGLLSFENIPDRTFAIYTNVSYHYDWVTTTTHELLCHHKDSETEEEAEDHHSEHSDNTPDYSSSHYSSSDYSSSKGDSTYTVEETEHGWESYDSDQGKQDEDEIRYDRRRYVT